MENSSIVENYDAQIKSQSSVCFYGKTREYFIKLVSNERELNDFFWDIQIVDNKTNMII